MNPTNPNHPSFVRPAPGYVCLAVLLALGWAGAVGSPPVLRTKIVAEARDVARGIEIAVPRAPVDGARWSTAVLRAAAPRGGAKYLRVRADEREAGTFALTPGGARIGVSLPEEPPPARLVLEADGAWRLQSLEVSTVHGYSRGLLNFAIISASAAPKVRWLGGAIALAGLLLLSATHVLPFASRPGRWLHALFGTAAAVLVAAALVSPFSSPYRIVVVPRTWCLCALLVFVGPIRERARQLLRAVANRPERDRLRIASLAAAAAAALFFGAVLAAAIARAGGNESALLHFSRRFADAAPMLIARPDLRASLVVGDEGYDGQFYYYMAFDPVIREHADEPRVYRQYLDDPPYRYGRIAYSWLAWAGSLGRPERFAWSMLWLLPLAHGLAAWFLCRYLVRGGASPWWTITYVVNAGLMASLLFGLPEALAAAFLVGGAYFWDRRRLGVAAALLAAALLTRENCGIFVLALAGAEVVRSRAWRGAAMLAASLVPAAAWRGYMCWRFFETDGLRGFWANPGDVTVPFAGVLGAWRALPPGALGQATLVYPVLLVLGCALAVWAWRATRDPLALAGAAYAVLALSLNYDKIWHHLASAERGSYELWLALTLVVVRVPASARRLRLAFGAAFAALAVYVFLISPDASAARAGLLLFE